MTKDTGIKHLGKTTNLGTTTATGMTTWVDIKCHAGNSAVWKHPRGGTLYIGGWAKGAKFDWNTHVIDLTGNEHKFWDVPFSFDSASDAFMPFLKQSYAGWLSLPFPDYKVPAGLNTREQWDGIAGVIKNILASGKDVLVACQGGHGRSGLFCAIVGYILGVKKDRSWSSPVEKIRKIHCLDSVETFEQEKYVYAILGLNIQIKQSYGKNVAGSKDTKECPLCGTQSIYVDEIGMCLGCRQKYTTLAPERMDLTIEDIKHKGMVNHSCKREKCVGIWKAQKCGHVTHDMIIYEGWCQTCWDTYQDEVAYAEGKLEGTDGMDDDEETEEKWSGECPMCGGFTMYAKRFGVCYSCSEGLVESQQVDAVHNSITDPYRAVPHHCDETGCVGIVLADVCGHVVHNLEIEDGQCPECRAMGMKRGAVQ